MKKIMAKPKNLEQWLIPRLRNISRYWPEKNFALNAAKVKVHIGFYKNGNPEYKVMVKCACCELLYVVEDIQMDHIKPIVSMDGFKDWNEYIPALLCYRDLWQALCKPCHYIKTQAENEERRKNKKLVKK